MTSRHQDDQEGLLYNAGSLATSPYSQTAYQGHEMDDLRSGDIGMYNTAHPPSYESLDQTIQGRDSSFQWSSPDKGFPSSQTPPESIQVARNSIQNAFHRFMRILLRSGTWGSHISYKPANLSANVEGVDYSGWRGGCLAACTIAGIVLFLNVIFSIYAAATSKSGMKIGSLYEGDCDTAARADSALHIIINVMGTLLLGASNYTMQCISSPTRGEIDRAHSKGRYLDIGLPSIRNLEGWRKKILFWLLVASTMPLHFLWNSAVFTTTQEVDYQVAVVTPPFLDAGTPVNCSQEVFVSYSTYSYYTQSVQGVYSTYPIGDEKKTYKDMHNVTQTMWVTTNPAWYSQDSCSILGQMKGNATGNLMTRLSNAECISTYGTTSTKLSKWGHVLAVTKARPESSNATVLLQFNYQNYMSNYTGNNWVCGPHNLIENNYKCYPKSLALAADSWTLGILNGSEANPYLLAETEQYEIDYCLALKTDVGGKCLLQYSMVIMTCVIIANAFKLACIFWVVKTSHEPVLATIGDGISSFLERPDRITVERPFLTRHKARRFKPLSTRLSKVWRIKETKHRWWKGPSKARWFITLSLCTLAISLVAWLLGMGNDAVTSNSDTFVTNPYSLGFGRYNKAAIVNIFNFVSSDPDQGDGDISKDTFNSSKFLIQMVAVANIPQFIVSSLYFAYNTVYTSMVSADEWARFSSHRKALRTTSPRGAQRSTYWLSLPWTYSLPLSMSSMLIHYLISQSLFVARTEILNPNGEVEPISYMQVGYSPLAILLALLFGSFMVIAMILNGFRKLAPSVLVGNNSLAISAACHRPEWDTDAHLRKVQWGAIKQPQDGVPGHCTFTSGDVEEPLLGRQYI